MSGRRAKAEEHRLKLASFHQACCRSSVLTTQQKWQEAPKILRCWRCDYGAGYLAWRFSRRMENFSVNHWRHLKFRCQNSLLRSVQLTRELSAPYPVFGYMEYGKVLLRPLKTNPSAAVIRLPAIRGLVEISCEAFIDDRRCETRGLAARIVVTSKGISVDQAEKGEGVLAATDWTELNEALMVSKLMVRFTDVQNDPVDMHLFTRLPKPGPVPPHGRVVFKQFATEVHTRSAWDTSPIMLRES